MRKVLAAGIAALMSGMLLTTPGVARADCGEVSITEMNWASSQIITEVAKFLMEQGYGCSVEKVPSATTTAVASLAETAEPGHLEAESVAEAGPDCVQDIAQTLRVLVEVDRMIELPPNGGNLGHRVARLLQDDRDTGTGL